MRPMQHSQELHVALLTAGRDHPYAFGMGSALMEHGFALDIIGGNDLDLPLWSRNAQVRFLNLRGDLSENAGIVRKILRVLGYYLRLILYSLKSNATVFHILWNNKFETFDRVPLMLFYRFLGKKTLMTVHNVNTRERDSRDSWFNRFTLGFQYRLADHLFVHTERMKQELMNHYAVPNDKITVIPFGINNAVPHTAMTLKQARERLLLAEHEQTILFFGNIAPYKGLEYLLEAFRQIMSRKDCYRLVIAGNPKCDDTYWSSILELLNRHPYAERILRKIEFVPDAETEVYFKGADVLVLPYRHIFQSGVLSLGYSFGLPVIASDIGSLRDDIVEGRTGFVCRPEDPADLARVIERYFASDLYRSMEKTRREICEYAHQRYSWGVVSEITRNVYMDVVGKASSHAGYQSVPR